MFGLQVSFGIVLTAGLPLVVPFPIAFPHSFIETLLVCDTDGCHCFARNCTVWPEGHVWKIAAACGQYAHQNDTLVSELVIKIVLRP